MGKAFVTEDGSLRMPSVLTTSTSKSELSNKLGIVQAETKSTPLTEFQQEAERLNQIKTAKAAERYREMYSGASKNAADSLGLAVLNGISVASTGFNNISGPAKTNFMDNAFQQVSFEEREKMSGVIKVAYDVVSNFVANAPSTAASLFSGGTAGAMVTFAQTFGNAKKYALDSGHDEKTAVTYAFFEGLNEATLDKLIDGVAGKSVVSSAAKKLIVENVKSGVAKFFWKLTSTTLSEYAQESIQTATENKLKNLLLGENNDASIFSEEAVYAGFLGALSAGSSRVAGATVKKAISDIDTTTLGSQYIKGENGHTIDEAIQIGINNARSGDTYRAAVKLENKVKNGERITAYEVGYIVQQSSSVEAITARLIEEQVLESAKKHNVDATVAENAAAVASLTGVPIVFAEPKDMEIVGEDGKIYYETGRFNREDGVITLNAGITTVELEDYVLKHELAHYAERSGMGQQLEQIVRSSMGAEFDAAVQAKLAEYQNYGKKLDEAGAKHEVVAQWLGKNLYQNGFAQAVVNGDAKVGNVILRTLDQVRLALGGTQKSRTAANIAIVERLFMRALQQSPAFDNSGGVQFSFVGIDKDGRRKYESGFGDDVPMETREKLFKERIATIFNLGAVELRTDVKKIVINGDKFTMQKNMYGDKKAEPDEMQAKINALYDLADILQTSEYLPDKTQKEPSYEDPTIPPKNDAHKGVKYWYKFQNKIELDGAPYTVTFNIRDKGKEQYQYLIDFKKEGHLVSHTTANSLRRAYQMPVDSTVPQNGGGVNTQYMQNGQENSQSSFEGSDDIAEAVALMERERTQQDQKTVETYNEEQYNNFGWASANNVVTAFERETLLSRYADFKHGKENYPVTTWGDTVVFSSECSDVIMYVSGEIVNPKISQIVRITADTEFEATIIREGVLANEYDQIQQPYAALADAFGEEVFRFSKKRDFASFQEYQSGAKRNGSRTIDPFSTRESIGTGSYDQSGELGQSTQLGITNHESPPSQDGAGFFHAQNGTQSSFEGSDEIAEAIALMERERAEQGAVMTENAPLNESNPSTADAVPLPLHKGGDEVTVNNIPSPLESGRVSEGTVSQAQTVDELMAEIGDEAAYRRMYYAAQIDRPPATMDIDGRTVNTTAYMDELYVALPDDDLQLTAYLKEREAEKAAQVAERFARGETDAEWTEVDLQILTARSKLEWSELGDSGESGSKTRLFYEQRLKGRDVNKAHEEELLEILAGRSETYSPIANVKTLEKAQNKLRNAEYQTALRKRILRYKPNDLFNAVDAAAAQVMINDARNEGDLELYADLVQGLSRKGTELGRAVQVLSMQRRMTPEGTLKAAQRTLRSQADKAMYDGANEDLDIFAETITDAIERAEAAAQGAETAVIDMLEKIRSGQFKQNEKVFFGSVTPGVASKIKELTGIDVSDFQVAIEARQLEHILKRHGENGISDQSMADDNDIAKIGRVVRDPDDIQPSGKSTAYTYTENGRNKLADTVLYEKNVGEKSYYVVQAVANTKKKILYIVTAFSQNNANLKGAQQFTDAQGPSANAQDAAVDTPIDTISQNELVVNVEVPLTRDELTEALVQDITADNSPYITADEIRGILERAVESASDIPDQLKRYLKKSLGEDMGTLAQRIAKLYEAGHLNDMTMRRVMEEALDLPRLTDKDVETLTGLVNALNDAPEGSAQQLEATEDIYRFLGEKLIVTKLDTLQSWRKFGMLFNAKTHLRNFGSNAVFAGVDRIDGAMATWLERVLIPEAEKRTAAFGWSFTEQGQQIRPAIEKSLGQALLKMRGQGQKYEVSNGVLNQYRKAFGKNKFGETLNTLNEKNSQLLEWEDAIFFKAAYTNALGQIMVARGLTEVNSDVENIAYKRAVEAVFRGENAMTNVLASIKRYQNSTKLGHALFGHAVDIAIPFSKTPANIAYQAVEHSPIGFVKGAWDILQVTRGKSPKTMAEAINLTSKGFTGTALLGIGMLLGSLGLFVTGFGKTEKERAADELAGIQENAFRFGNVTISLDWLQPAASPLIVGASIAQRLKEDGLSLGSVFGATFDGTDSLFEMTMLQSLYDVLGGYEAGASASVASVAENLLSQSVPTVLGQVARAVDPVQRKANGESALTPIIGNGTFAKVVQRVLARIPGLTYLLEPELDVWGNTVYRTGKASTMSGILNALQQFILPANVKIATGDDEISQIVMELYDGDEKQPGRAIPTAITREKAAELGVSYEDVNRLLGQNQHEALLAILQDREKYTVTHEITRGGKTVKQKRQKYWSDMTDEERLQVLKKVYQAEKDKITDPDGEYYEEIVRRMN